MVCIIAEELGYTVAEYLNFHGWGVHRSQKKNQPCLHYIIGSKCAWKKYRNRWKSTKVEPFLGISLQWSAVFFMFWRILTEGSLLLSREHLKMISGPLLVLGRKWTTKYRFTICATPWSFLFSKEPLWWRKLSWRHWSRTCLVSCGRSARFMGHLARYYSTCLMMSQLLRNRQNYWSGWSSWHS